MKESLLITPEWYLFAQAIGDAMGYPKSEQNKRQIGCSNEDLRTLHSKLLDTHDEDLTDTEKQAVLNSIDGALDYVNSDIPSLYDITEIQLRDLKEDLEKRWNIKSTYNAKR